MEFMLQIFSELQHFFSPIYRVSIPFLLISAMPTIFGVFGLVAWGHSLEQGRLKALLYLISVLLIFVFLPIELKVGAQNKWLADTTAEQLETKFRETLGENSLAIKNLDDNISTDIIKFQDNMTRNQLAMIFYTSMIINGETKNNFEKHTVEISESIRQSTSETEQGILNAADDIKNSRTSTREISDAIVSMIEKDVDSLLQKRLLTFGEQLDNRTSIFEQTMATSIDNSFKKYKDELTKINSANLDTYSRKAEEINSLFSEKVADISQKSEESLDTLNQSIVQMNKTVESQGLGEVIKNVRDVYSTLAVGEARDDAFIIYARCLRDIGLFGFGKKKRCDGELSEALKTLHEEQQYIAPDKTNIQVSSGPAVFPNLVENSQQGN